MPDVETRRFPFAIDPTYRWPARLFGVHRGTAEVLVDEHHLQARFGPWVVRTPLANVAGAEVTGPYALPLTIGPAHLSLTDRGLTFATNGSRGVCITFRAPVRGIEPLGLLRHPGLTVTVADVDGLVQALRPVDEDDREPSAPANRLEELEELHEEVEEERREQAAEDNLHTMTAAELRRLAAERGVTHRSAAKKAELVELLEADLADDLVEELAPER